MRQGVRRAHQVRNSSLGNKQKESQMRSRILTLPCVCTVLLVMVLWSLPHGKGRTLTRLEMTQLVGGTACNNQVPYAICGVPYTCGGTCQYAGTLCPSPNTPYEATSGSIYDCTAGGGGNYCTITNTNTTQQSCTLDKTCNCVNQLIGNPKCTTAAGNSNASVTFDINSTSNCE